MAFNERFPDIAPMGDSAVTIRFGNRIDAGVHARVMAFSEAISAAGQAGILECVPAYAAVTVFYDPVLLSYEDVEKWIFNLKQVGSDRARSARSVEIPVCYGGAYGPDLAEVAAYHDISPDDVIRLHSESEYVVYMLGFAPGFPYLGGLDKHLATPRLDVPRTLVPAGSVGIGGQQTGVYTVASPGGWRLIGRTPLRLFTPDAAMPTLLQAGDVVRFIPVTSGEFEALRRGWNA